MEIDNYQSYMIVFSKDNKRKTNFGKINNILKKLRYFEAIDTLNYYEQWKTFSLKHNYASEKYLNQEVENNRLGFLKGKLGCNLSHQLLLEHISNNYYKNLKNKDNKDNKDNKNNQQNDKWHLILEDDLFISDKYTPEEIDLFLKNLINKINIISPKTMYIQLCVYPQFQVNQNKTETIGSFEVNNQEFKIKKKLPQYGTCAYLINKVAIKYLTDAVRPWGKNIDFLYNSLDQPFNSVAIINPYFQCAGSVDAKDNRDTEFGSLIW